jgi:hypothetical protein
MSIQGWVLIDHQYCPIRKVLMISVVIVERVMTPVQIWYCPLHWGVKWIGVQGQTPPQLSAFLMGIFWPDARRIGMRGTTEETQAKQRQYSCPRFQRLQELPISEQTFR